MDIDGLKNRIEQEYDAGEIGDVIDNIIEEDKEAVVNLVNRLDLRVLAGKIDAEDDVRKIGRCVGGIFRVNPDAAARLVQGVDFEKLKSKIEAEDDIESVSFCIGEIACAVPGKIERLMPVIRDRIDAEEDTGKIGSCFFNICKNGDEGRVIADRLLRHLDFGKLTDKIKSGDDIAKIVLCITGIAGANREIAGILLTRIGFLNLKNKIESGDDIEIIGGVISEISKVNKEFAWKLIPVLKDKIECEEDIQKINWCLSNFDDDSRDVAGKIVSVLDLDSLTGKLESDMNFYKRSFFEILSVGFPVFNMELHNVPFRTSWTPLV